MALPAFAGALTGQVERLDDGLLVRLKHPAPGGARQVKLQVVTDRIIHVSASAEDTFSTTQSLMVTATGREGVKWDASENSEEVVLRTAALSVTVALNSGRVTFRDKAGNVILQEHSRAFRPVTIDNKPLYRIRQLFESPAGEAFYGLGQPQTGVMNYKDQDVDLTQYNSIAAVPFLVSNRHYGILWDNYSITRFGDDRPHEQLSVLTGEGGLTATYADRKDQRKIYLKRNEPKIDYAFLPDLQHMPAAFPMSKGKVTWEGNLAPDQSGAYKFYVTASGYIKIWVDGKLVLDRWREGWNPGPSVFSQHLAKGKKVPLKVEWIPESSQAFVSLKWLSPTPEALHNKMCFSSEAGEKIDYYFMQGENMDDVISGYRQVTGKATMLPQWALGFWQSRERYKTQAEILQTVQEFRKRQIPLDNIVLDWSYWKEDAWGSQEFDPARFPDPKGMLDQLHDKYHTHFMISVWPKFYEGISTYKMFDAKNWLYKQNITNKQRDWIGQGYISTFYDAFQPEARQLFWNIIDRKLFSLGVDAWWLDATEPDILSNASIDERKQLMNPTAAGPAAQYFNTYSLMNAKGVYEGQRASKPDQRAFILTRNANAGIQRYAAAAWSGDISARFDELERQIPAGLNLSLSGIPWWTTDIGGFFVEDKYDQPDPQGADLEEWRELNARWFQYGAFCPLFRSHGQYPYREIFNIAPEHSDVYRSMLYYSRLRYKLMPYIYSLAGRTYHDDYTLMRALPMDFPADTAVLRISDQFMFGPALLVNPVYHYKARHRSVYLPATAGWYDFYTGQYYKGGQHITADAPLQRMPLYVKAGSILPFGPDIQYTGEKPADTIVLRVYTGGDASFRLYEDEGLNYGYEKGRFSNIPVRWNESAGTLTIGAREGSFPGMLRQRYFRVIYIHPGSAKEADGGLITYNGEEQTNKAGDWK
ncbi:TIM-barrel domain-containing protein [Chitinophaga cymbidii]|uniref:Alpha-xylosidase n=1 Tax=Chitinophaga cymbidii TaxID=1096750 RepID=A0A512RTC1_9BACT|nr:TIM-barrel domain-containing protein [Chitinophaga cymbidii]GEP98946.1 alpha-xylosidase [Chitinophaga cymbidii]